MSKSVLVIDTPKCCAVCNLLYYCHKYDDVIDMWNKPDWCPLKELPEHELIWNDDDDWERGFNFCLDNILRGE